ncbi:unnamed protein product [Vitrella brassicaformis CCMP3155]|uniref:SPRY domain-containing protein n=1 Tax=Vitrella brassicaformis (strain CCMP3155) TaxID=1169540 RepID=A0A0G4EEB5_VITBC|nr:unnamed protein product [Vitrella brassicaformis CCMP3155]|eukprot:CEL93691.1 unnamed protein product [Vitrella brassicaformis CCMP3155]
MSVIAEGGDAVVFALLVIVGIIGTLSLYIGVRALYRTCIAPQLRNKAQQSNVLAVFLRERCDHAVREGWVPRRVVREADVFGAPLLRQIHADGPRMWDVKPQPRSSPPPDLYEPPSYLLPVSVHQEVSTLPLPPQSAAYFETTLLPHITPDDDNANQDEEGSLSAYKKPHGPPIFAVGVCPSPYPPDYLPGLFAPSIALHNLAYLEDEGHRGSRWSRPKGGEGGIYNGSVDACTPAPFFDVGATIGCEIDRAQGRVTFFLFRSSSIDGSGGQRTTTRTRRRRQRGVSERTRRLLYRVVQPHRAPTVITVKAPQFTLRTPLDAFTLDPDRPPEHLESDTPAMFVTVATTHPRAVSFSVNFGEQPFLREEGDDIGFGVPLCPSAPGHADKTRSVRLLLKQAIAKTFSRPRASPLGRQEVSTPDDAEESKGEGDVRVVLGRGRSSSTAPSETATLGPIPPAPTFHQPHRPPADRQHQEQQPSYPKREKRPSLSALVEGNKILRDGGVGSGAGRRASEPALGVSALPPGWMMHEGEMSPPPSAPMSDSPPLSLLAGLTPLDERRRPTITSTTTHQPAMRPVVSPTLHAASRSPPASWAPPARGPSMEIDLLPPPAAAASRG